MTARHARRIIVGIGSIAVALTIGAAPMSADATGGLSVGTTTLAPGSSTSVDATFAAVAATAPVFVTVRVDPVGAVTGSVSLSAPDFSAADAVTNCGPALAPINGIDCLWIGSAVPQSGRVTMTLAASSDASGTFRVTTTQVGPVGGSSTPTPVAGPVDVVVGVATTTAPSTTIATAATTTIAGAAVPTTTASAGGTGGLPATGSSETWFAALIGVALMIAGTGTLMATRRPNRPT